MQADLIITNIREIATTIGASDAPRKGEGMAEIEVIPNAAIAAKDGVLIAVGRCKEIIAEVDPAPGAATIDAEQRIAIPGLVDPHTHLLYAGRREDEFAMRASGQSYMEIMQAGGGLYRTVRETRAASEDALITHGRRMVAMMLRQGSTTIEVKSGYGLSTASELKMLRCIDDLSRSTHASIVATFLGAHAVPEEFQDRPADFVDLVVTDMLPAAWESGLARYCDIFCEKGVFDPEKSQTILEAAAKYGFAIKVHGNELGHSGGVQLAVDVNAVSVDHCNFLSDTDIEALQNAETIAVGLPGTPFFRLAPQYADGRRIVDEGIPLALATDINPTASVSSMFFVMFLACLEMKITPSEALAAATINAAHTIGVADQVGSLEVGKAADVLLLDVDDFRHIPFNVGRDLVDLVIKHGHPICGKRFEQCIPPPTSH